MTTSASDLRRELREMRAEGTDRPRLSSWGNWYMGILSLVVLGSMMASQLDRIFSPQPCHTGLCEDVGARRWIVMAITMALLALTSRAARLLGPLGAGRAVLTWLHSTPVDRRGLVMPSYVRALVGFAALGALQAGVVILVAGTLSAAHSVTILLAGMVAAVGLAACATGSQINPSWARAQAAMEIGAIGVAGAMALNGIVGARGSLHPVPTTVAASVTGAVALLSLVLAARQGVRLGQVGAGGLRRGGEVQEAIVSTTVMLDADGAGALAQGRRRAWAGRYRSRPMIGTGLVAVVTAEGRRLVRRPRLLAAVVASALIPAAVMPLTSAFWGHMTVLLVVGVCGRALGGGLNAWSRSSGFRRLLPAPIWQVRLALLVPGAVVLTVWSASVVALAGLPAWSVVPFAAGGLVGMLRAAEPPRGDDFAVLVPTELGAIPVGLIRRLLDGWIETALCVLIPVVISSAVPALVALFVLINTVTRAQWKERGRLGG